MPRIPNKRGNINVEDIYIALKCPECDTIFNCKCRGPVTMKNCKCNNATFVVTLEPSKGYVNVTVVFKGSSYVPGFISPVGYSLGMEGELVLFEK